MNGLGATCTWQPGTRPTAQRVMAENVMELLIAETCERYGFQMFWREDGDTRTLELLGPDSPGEYVYTLHKRDLIDGTVQDIARDLYWWITARGRIYDHE